MQKVSPRKNNNRHALIIILVVVFAIGILSVYLIENNRSKLVKITGTQTTQTENQKNQEKAASAESKQQYLDNVYGASQSGQSQNNKPTQNNDPQDLSIEAKQEGAAVVVLTKIKGVASGTCNLSVTMGGLSISESSQIIYQPEFSSCAGFSIPINKLGSGSWVIKLTVNENPNLVKETSLAVQ